MNNPWTPDDDKLLAELVAAGKSFAEAGAIIGRSKNSCISRSRRNGVKSKYLPGPWRLNERAETKVPRVVPRWAAFWTDGEIEQLRQMRSDGLTVREIALKIGRSFKGVSCALSRYGIAAPENHRSDCHKKIATDIPPSVISEPERPIIVCEGVSLEDLAFHHCRWPSGDTEIRFCGETRREGSSYCPSHHAVAYSGRKATAAERRRVEISVKKHLVRQHA